MEQKVVITDIDIPFDRLVILIVKINLAVLGFVLCLLALFVALAEGVGLVISFFQPVVLIPLLVVLIIGLAYRYKDKIKIPMIFYYFKDKINRKKD